jgi:E1A/CREB-binding protein
MTIDDSQHSQALKTGKQNDRKLLLAFAFVTISLAPGLIYGWLSLGVFALCLFMLAIFASEVLPRFHFSPKKMEVQLDEEEQDESNVETEKKSLVIINDDDSDKLETSQQQRLLLLHHSSKCQAPDGKYKATPYCKEMKRLWFYMARCEDYNCRVQHCYSSRTILSHYRKCKDQVCLICKPVRISVWKGKGVTPSLGENDGGISYPSSSSSNPNPSTHQPVSSDHSLEFCAPIIAPISAPYPPPSTTHNQRPLHPPAMERPPISNPYPPENQNSRMPLAPEMRPAENDEWKKRIVHKQQRLLLLRHASKCTAEEGKCEVTPHCHSTKLLWQHISSCSKKDCEVAHCISSRYVLMHYRKCKDLKCPPCQPVREAIRKGHEKKHGISMDTLVGGVKRSAPEATPYPPPFTPHNQRPLHPPAMKRSPITKSMNAFAEDYEMDVNQELTGFLRDIINRAAATGDDEIEDNLSPQTQSNNGFGNSGAAGSGRATRLSDIFATPFHLTHSAGGFQGAINVAKDSKRWLLVNLQSDSDFACHALNRDVWRDELCENLIREGFIFWQSVSTA